MVSNQKPTKLWFVVLTSALSSVIEWYDLHLFGTLLAVFIHNFFIYLGADFSLIASLLSFGTGMVVRPLSALFLGWMGDTVGRKHTFLITLILMGGATSAIGLVPNYNQAQGFSIALLILLRLIQGIAFGGEYGAAVILIAEHAPERLRGTLTSILQSLATVGLALAIFVNITLEAHLGEEQFFAWGWRISFLLSIVLVIISYLLRKNLTESPAFHDLRLKGLTSSNPLYESFCSKENLKKMILVFISPLLGQGVLWYTVNSYSSYFLHNLLGFSFTETNIIVFTAILAAAPFNIFFGYLSDLWGRLPIILTGLFVSILLLFPTYYAIHSAAGEYFLSASADEKNNYKQIIILFLFLQSIFVAMVYGPVSGLLIDMFPMRIRFTSLSFPYHVANGVFGSSVTLIASSINYTQEQSTLYAGLYYPFSMCVISFTVGFLFFKSKYYQKTDS